MGLKIPKMTSRIESKDPGPGPRDREPRKATGCVRCPDKGFTLIEVLLAVSILAIGLVSVLRAYAISTSAMEKSQYDMDAVFLLQKTMGQIEETFILQGGKAPGVTNGEYVSTDDAKLDRQHSGSWLWNEEVQKMDLPIIKKKSSISQDKTKSEAEKKPDFYLDKLTLTLANSGRMPPRKVSVETYVGIENVKNT